MLSALYAIARPSVRLSDGWIVQKMVKARIMQFSPYGSTIHLVLRGKFHWKILRGSPSEGIKQGSGGKNKPFSSIDCQYLENGSRYGQSNY